MWDVILGRLPSKIIIVNACLSIIIPWSLYKVHQALLKYGDPPWKKNEDRS